MSEREIDLRSLTPQQRALLELRLQSARKKRASGEAGATIPKREPGRAVPLSFAQQRLWLLQQLEPESAAYNTPVAYRLKGLLDREALRASLSEIVRRHESLRARFVEEDGSPRQVIEPARPLPLAVVDLGGLDEGERKRAVHELSFEEARRPFDLEAGPVVRASLLHLGPTEAILLVTMHHIVCDGWSLAVFLKEVRALYAAFSRGKPSPLAAPEIQYPDYACWQRDGLTEAALEKQLAYWRRQLDSLSAVEIATDVARSMSTRAEGRKIAFRLDPELTRGLDALAKAEGFTLFMVLLAAFQTLLMRESGNEDVVTGSAIANRRRSELEGLVGFFANTLVMRTDLSGDPPFRELVARVRSVALEAYEHQDVPFERLVEELVPERDLSRSPLFQVAFTFQNVPREPAQNVPSLGALEIQPIDVTSGTTRFDLTFELMEAREAIVGAVTYRSDLFHAERVGAILSRFERLLRSIVRNPDARLSELSMFSAEERLELLRAGNDTDAAYPQSTIHACFEQRAKERPEAFALVEGSERWTYRELDGRANRLSRYLRKLGVGPGSRVGIALDRSPRLVTSLLAVLKAGGAYVPLDPAYPSERLRFMVVDAGLTALVTERAVEGSLPGVEIPRVVVDGDGDASAIAGESEASLETSVGPDALAYVIYTSGSTGLPKGVEIPHRGVLRLVLGVDYVQLGPAETLLGLAPISFDASTFEIWGALLTGARLALFPERIPLTGELGAVLRDSEVTTLWLTASLFNAVVDESPEILAGVRQLLVGGEALSARHVARAYEHLPETVIVNGYGPTEGTTFTCCYAIPREHVQTSSSISIGRPIANTRVYVLDPFLSPAPPGARGELYIGGDGLARGYRSRPELTAATFVPNPFSERPGARLYRTGDLVRRLPDGNLEFLGRFDHQVKIRGFRIELDEIAAALRAHPLVATAAVLAPEDEGSGKSLVAFIVWREPSGPSVKVSFEALREFLARRLPDYMLPSELVSLPELPLTPNGKLDRDALLATRGGGVRREEGVPPRGPVEESLAEIWREVLGISVVGAHDHFFQLGGHSLLAARVASRARKAFGVELPLRAVFEAPSLSDLAKRIEEARGGPEGQVIGLTPLPPGETRPLSLPQQRLWLLDRLGFGGAAYNISGGLRLEGKLNEDALAQSLLSIVARHESLRTTIDVDGRYQRVHAAPSRFPLPVVDLRGMEEEARRKVVERSLAEEARRPFELAAGPLFRCRLLKLADEDHVFQWTMHHIVSDGWSVGVFFRELGHFYRAFSRGERPGLAPLRVQYGDYASWQQRALSGEALERQLEFWRARLRDAPLPAGLPADRTVPDDVPPRGRRFSRALGEPLAVKLEALARSEGATLFTTLVAGFQALLHRYSGREDVLVGTPVANREREELEDVIGFFVNTLVLRTDLSGRPSFSELLRRVREDLLSAFDHKDVPFERLVEELRPKRRAAENPFFEAVIAFQGSSASESRPDLEGLAVSHVPLDLRTLRFELELHLFRRPEGMLVLVSYDENRFAAATVARLVDHFEALLEAAALSPHRAIAEIPLVTLSEREDLARWNDTASAYPRESSIDEVFEAVAERRADEVAVSLDGLSCTYAELDRRANQLARHLRARGVRREAPVGLALGRSVEAVVGILGILKAGGVYVPLDASYPEERLRFLIHDAAIALVLGDEELRTACPPGVTVLDPTREADAIGLESEAALERAPVTADALAYVMYTSGSTGIPKGVGVSHRAVLRLVLGTGYVALGPEERILQLAPLSFDASTFEIWAALLNGGRLVLHRERLPSAESLTKVFRDERISTLWLTASLFNALVDEEPSLFASVRQLLVGGEALSVPHVRKALAGAPRLRIINGYGPTEGTTFSCCYAVPSGPSGSRELAEDATSIPIGSPIANTYVRVLDESFELVPIGVEGELFLGGDGLARGYLGRADKTAERFVPDPFAADPGRRLYRTGDRVRFDALGRLEFLGRFDHQVKLRGFRVEPGEVEAVLLDHPDVREAVVVVGRDARDDKVLHAFVVAAPGRDARELELRRYLEGRLPDYMIPSRFVTIDRLPLTPNGKLDRSALPAPRPPEQPLEPEARSGPTDELEERIAAAWREVLDVERVGMEDNFFDLGGHSLLLLRLQSRLKEALGLRRLSPLELFRHPTVRALADHLRSRASADAPRAASVLRRLSASEPIAIVGVAGRFPRSENVEIFWENLRAGRECLTFYTEEELLSEGLDPVEFRHPQYVKARGALENADRFDAAFFGYTPREAEILDPQQRLFLETAWEALERAGYGNELHRGHGGSVGVFAGASTNRYQANLLARPDVLRSLGRYQTFLSNDKDFLATRISYKLNLRGPSVTIQSACSTSLVAVHLACQSLREGDCELALAGGVSIGVPRRQGYRYAEGGILSRDGHCRAFDAKASGTVGGEGVGVVVLKRLRDALESGDRVEAVLLGSASNNDGSHKVGYTAPSIEGQAEVIARALDRAGVASSTLSYVETHGTGTALGDPIEVAALKKVFEPAAENSCGLGSLKTNVGHLDAAAGVASLIKAVLALEHQEIPPSLHFDAPNPELGLEKSPFYVNASLKSWNRSAKGTPRRCGVSSFGIGGTNAHVVLEEAPAREPSGPSRPFQILTLSAKSEASFARMTEALVRDLEAHPERSLADVCFTLGVGRSRFPRRRALVVSGDVAEAARRLASGEGLGAREEETRRGLAFVYPGQGTQYVNMGRTLYEQESVFREELERGFTLLQEDLGSDPRAILYPAPGKEASASALLSETRWTQPLLFIFEHALTTLFQSFGLVPEALLGHSIGEYVAASVAGVFDFETGVRLSALRGRLMQEAPRGSMTSVLLSEEELLSRLGEGLSLAAVNGSSLTVVSGPTERIASFERELEKDGVSWRRLPTSHAFHSELMEPVLSRFEEAIRGIRFEAPRIPYLSNVTGRWIQTSEATDPSYWVRHLRAPVRFAEGARRLVDGSSRAVVSMGGGLALPAELRRSVPLVVSPIGPRPSATDVEGNEGARAFAECVARLWVAGAPVDWEGYYARERRERVLLPTYSFDRRRYWIDPPKPGLSDRSSTGATGKRAKVSEWLYAPVWRSSSSDGALASFQPWLFFNDRRVSRAIAKRLDPAGDGVVEVRPGESFQRLGERRYEIRPDVYEDYAHLFEELSRDGFRPERIVHGWMLDPLPSDGRLDFARRRGLQSLASLGRALERSTGPGPTPAVAVLTSNLHEVTGEEPLEPEKALLTGALKALPQENRALVLGNIDLALALDGDVDDFLLDAVMREIASTSLPPTVALRGRKRFLPDFEPFAASKEAPSVLRASGVYWITGGLGRVGLALAERLAREKARLVLFGRTALPPRGEWDAVVRSAGADDPDAQRLRRILAMEAMGAEVLVARVDVTDEARLRELLSETKARFGALHGVFHAAGTTSGPSFRPVVKLTEAHISDQLDAKVRGLFVLEGVLRDTPLDFVLVTSSIAAVLGGIGYGAYASANAVLDRWALERSRKNGPRCWSVDLEGWRFESNGEGGREAATAQALAMTPEEGVAVIDLVLRSRGAANLVVSTADLSSRLHRWVGEGLRSADEPSEQPSSPAAERRRPEVGAPFEPPRDEVERAVVEIWERTLGIEGIGIHDDFFELGGHSLSALQLANQLSERFASQLPMHRLFEAPTPAAVAAYLRNGGDGSSAEKLESLLESVESMTDGEARELLEWESERDE